MLIILLIEMGTINVAVVGLGNCAGALLEGLEYYSGLDKERSGLLFPVLGGYDLSDIEIVCAFDISQKKIDKTISQAVYQYPNNFNRILSYEIKNDGPVYRGPTLDGNPTHLQMFFEEAVEVLAVDVVDKLKYHQVDVVVNLLPTGSNEATAFYGMCALQAHCAFVNCIPSVFVQDEKIQHLFEDKGIPIVGDDIKSQVGSTIIHRAVLNMLADRGATIRKSSQINIGGNTDFANFVHRAQTKLVSKYKSLRQYLPDGVPNHIGHHYDVTKDGYKKTLFDIESTVFGGSKVKIFVQLESDDKPNSAGSIIDLIRIVKYEKDHNRGGCVFDACSYYNKSAPRQLKDFEAYERVKKQWGSN